MLNYFSFLLRNSVNNNNKCRNEGIIIKIHSETRIECRMFINNCNIFFSFLIFFSWKSICREKNICRNKSAAEAWQYSIKFNIHIGIENRKERLVIHLQINLSWMYSRWLARLSRKCEGQCENFVFFESIFILALNFLFRFYENSKITSFQ